MAVSFSSTSGAVSVAPLDVITSALLEAGIQAAGEDVSAEDAAWGLEKLQRLIDSLNAQRPVIFSHNFLLFNLTPNHAPHTIGPGGDFQASVRPVEIVSGSFVLNGSSSQPVDRNLRIRDDQWWAANPLKSLTSSICTDLYYDDAQPLGNLNFYPICNTAAPVRLETWNNLPQAIDYNTELGFVQGYWDAIVLSLAVRLCPSFNKPVSPDLKENQKEAMKIILANNNPSPRIDTNSGGMPGSARSGRPDFNFLTGMRE